MVNFCERLRALRTETGLSQTDFAARAGVTKKTQSLYERGERSPTAVYLSAVAEFTDVSYLLTGNRTVPSGLSQDEQTLLDRFRKCSPISQRHLLASAESFVGLELYET